MQADQLEDEKQTTEAENITDEKVESSVSFNDDSVLFNDEEVTFNGVRL